MKFINFAVVKLAACLTAGIVAAHFFPIVSFVVLKVVCLCILLLVIIWFRERRKIQPGIVFGIVAYFTFFTLGYSGYQMREPSQQKRHYSHFFSENTAELLQLKITEVLKPNRYQHRFFAKILQLNSQKVTGKILLNIQKDTSFYCCQVDEVLLVSAELDEVPAALNPYQFDYKKYLKNQEVYHQLGISKDEILEAYIGSATLKGSSESIREYIIRKLSDTAIDLEQRAITQALVLGQRRDIDKELYREYAAAGALHILAVSGMHVGILYLIFSWLLTPLDHVKFGKRTKHILLVVLLWVFAVLAGLSPSVVRAVTMFSFFAFAGLLNRTTNSFNTLILSYFVLLVFNPKWLFHVGFQLSYLAVFFILWVQPKLYKIYIPRFYLDRLLWGIITVTLAAQIGIAPLSVFYFHQFPGLFFITNLVILPFLTLLLAAGLLIVSLAILDSLPNSFALGYDWLIKQLNNFIRWVAKRETFLFDDISLSLLSMLVCYLVIITVILWCKQRNAKHVLCVLACFTLWSIVAVWETKSVEKEQLVLFHLSRNTLMGYKNGMDLTIFQNDTLDYFDRFPVKGFRVGSNVSGFTSEIIPNAFSFKGKHILRLDSLAVYPSAQTDIVLLTHSPAINLDRLIDSLNPSLIIADGSNYRSYVLRWEKTCIIRKILFHDTSAQGAYIFGENKL